MKKIVPFLFFFCVLLSKSCFSNGDTAQYEGPRQQAQSSFLLFNLSYSVPFNKAQIINSGHGFCADLGINPGYLISPKLLLGLFVRLSYPDRIWRPKFNSGFLNDFNTAFHNDYSGDDSLVIDELHEVMNGSRLNQHNFHDQAVCFGIIFHLPNAWCPTIKIYRGIMNTEYAGSTSYGPQCKATSDHEYITIERTLPWGVEMILYRGYQKILGEGPVGVTKKIEKRLLQYRNFNIGYISFYIQQQGLQDAKYTYEKCEHQEYALSNITNQAFVDKYKNVIGFGIKIGIGFL